VAPEPASILLLATLLGSASLLTRKKLRTSN